MFKCFIISPFLQSAFGAIMAYTLLKLVSVTLLLVCSDAASERHFLAEEKWPLFLSKKNISLN
jgi:hypothetical protein